MFEKRSLFYFVLFSKLVIEDQTLASTNENFAKQIRLFIFLLHIFICDYLVSYVN
ncbi:AAEL017018-PA [Aedes aegypti]|uniref:AAEL017018-PA n=1 Tax=Aedes aegypti TaxID=7159 RepID=J9HTS7_AEDAE|nr:AAEL017018-PA [Aedes aegypti]